MRRKQTGYSMFPFVDVRPLKLFLMGHKTCKILARLLLFLLSRVKTGCYMFCVAVTFALGKSIRIRIYVKWSWALPGMWCFLSFHEFMIWNYNKVGISRPIFSHSVIPWSLHEKLYLIVVRSFLSLGCDILSAITRQNCQGDANWLYRAHFLLNPNGYLLQFVGPERISDRTVDMLPRDWHR